VAGVKKVWEPDRSTQRFAGQPGQDLINPVKISISRIYTGFEGKEEFRMREKEFVWGSKQVRQNYKCKVKESDQAGYNPDQVRVKAVVGANVVDFFKKTNTPKSSGKLNF
jgi:hypothetical protein